MKQKLIVMVGLPASGKSTKGLQIAEDNDFAYISRDNVRDMLGMRYSTQAEDVVKKVTRCYAEAALIRGESVVIDATNLGVKSRASYVQLAKQYKADPLALVMNTSYETCTLRNAQREDGRVPVEKMRLMATDLVMPTKAEGFDGVYIYNEGEDYKWD